MAAALGDDFYRLAHDDVTGKPRLHGRAAGLGLAAALLGELIWGHHIWVGRAQLSVCGQQPPVDALAHTVLDQLAAQPRHRDVRTWLEFFSRTAVDDVAQRLFRAGHLRPHQTRRFLTKTVTYVPTDMNVAAMPSVRLSMALRRHRSISHQDAFLAGLCEATGLDRYLLDGASIATSQYLVHVVDSVWEPLRELILLTQAAVADAVLAYRG